MKFLFWTVPRKLIWWLIIRPIVIFILLFCFVTYTLCRWTMTLLLKIWYPGTRFGDYGFNDSSYHKYKFRRKDDLYQ